MNSVNGLSQGEALFFRYVPQIEELIGLPFFADRELSERFRNKPAQLPLEQLRSRAAVYVAGLQLIAGEVTALSDGQTMPFDWRANVQTIRERNSGEIAIMRGELMHRDPKLETEQIRRFRQAMEEYRMNMATRKDSLRPEPASAEKSIDVLPPHLIPIRAAARYLNISSGSRLAAVARRSNDAARLLLPGPQRTEHCISWRTLQSLEEHYGHRPFYQPLDYEKLPHGPDDTDPEKVTAARLAQLDLVPLSRLENVPELGGSPGKKIQYLPAREYEISRWALSRLLDGGYHFIDDYCLRKGWQPSPRISRYRVPGEFLTIEQAAEIWDAYHAIPPAGDTDIPVVTVAKDTGHGKRHIEDRLRSDEAPQTMRAQNPPGRVLRHIKKEHAIAVSERVRPDVLSPHILPLQVFEQVVQAKYTTMDHLLNRQNIEPVAYLRFPNMNTVMACYRWDVLEELVNRYGYRPDAPISIEFDKLPSYELDDENRIAYARTVQSVLVPREWLGLIPDVPAMPGWRPQGVVPPLRKTIGMSLSVDGIARLTKTSPAVVKATIASLDSSRYLPPQTGSENGKRVFLYSGEYLRGILVSLAGYSVEDLAHATGFWPDAVRAVAKAQGITTKDGRYQPGTLEALAALRPPRNYHLLRDVIAEAGMDETQARAFLDKHYGKIFEGFLDPSGQRNTYIDHHSKELLVRQRLAHDGGIAAGIRRANGWLHRRQITEITGKPIQHFEDWLRTHLTASNVIEWRIADDGAVLPHFDYRFVQPYLRQRSSP